MKKILVALVVLIVAVAFFALGRDSSTNFEARPSSPIPEGAEENDPTASAGKRAPNLAEQLSGEWRSVDDASFTRVLQADGNFYDTYNGDPAGAPGTWALATDGSEELRISSGGDVMRFRVVAVTETTLQLTYLDRGSTLRFSRALGRLEE